MCPIYHADCTAPTRQHELDHTDHTDHTDYTDEEFMVACRDVDHDVGIDDLFLGCVKSRGFVRSSGSCKKKRAYTVSWSWRIES